MVDRRMMPKTVVLGELSLLTLRHNHTKQVNFHPLSHDEEGVYVCVCRGGGGGGRVYIYLDMRDYLNYFSSQIFLCVVKCHVPFYWYGLPLNLKSQLDK